ncbi:MAG: PstS family phosphate ABC transporter substrate-binding protein [Gammaproteobacteria bacterium]
MKTTLRNTICGLSVGAVLTLAGANALAQSRDYISIVGSSTVYPFTTVVAERFGRSAGVTTPKVESTGTGGGMKLFCAGVGTAHPDLTGASRQIKKSEFEQCQANGVQDVIEVQIGFDGIVLANSVKTEAFELTARDIFLALAKEVPDGDSEKLIPNPYTTWKQVNPALPDTRIEVLGPPPTSGTRDAFAELAMEAGCKSFGWLKDLKSADKKHFKAICHALREDGHFIEAGENDNLIVQKLDANPKALGIFGFSFLEQNSDKVQGSIIGGVAPTFDTIADKSYPVSRPLFVYAKKAHIGVVPHIEGFLAELTSDKAWGDEGYLTDKGMIPMPESTRKEVASRVKSLTPMTVAGLQ